MGLWDDFVSGVSGFFDSAGFGSTADSATDFLGNYGSDILSSVGSYGSTPYAPAPVQSYPIGGQYGSGMPTYMNVGSTLTPAAVTGAAMAIGRSLATRFPNLWIAIQGYRASGMNVTRAKLYSLLKRFGPEFLIAGGILGAQAVSELMMAGPGRRRMNPGNVKALRRAHRRMKSFHHVCQVNDHLLTHRRRKSSGRGSCGTSITQVK